MTGARILVAVAAALALAGPAAGQVTVADQVVAREKVTAGTTTASSSPLTVAGLPAAAGSILRTGAGGAVGIGPLVAADIPSTFTQRNVAETIAGAWTFTTLAATGAATLGSTLSVAGAATLSSTLSVAGAISDPNSAVTVTPGLDVAGDALPVTAYGGNLGLFNRKWLTLNAGELQVQTLVAQDTMTTTGGRQLVGSANVLLSPLAATAAPGSDVCLKYDNLIANTGGPPAGDEVLLEARGQVEFMYVYQRYGETCVGADGSTGYRYHFGRNHDGSGANAWEAGDAVFSYSQFIDLYSLRGSSSQNLANRIAESRPVFYLSMNRDPNRAASYVAEHITNAPVNSYGTASIQLNQHGTFPGPATDDAVLISGDNSDSGLFVTGEIADRWRPGSVTGDLTLEFMFYGVGVPAATRVIASRHFTNEWHVQVDPAGYVNLCQGNGSGYGCSTSAAGYWSHAGGWTHYLIRRQAEGGNWRVSYWRAGVKISEQLITQAIAENTGTFTMLGRNPQATGGSLAGYYSEFAVYARALPDAEIATHYQATLRPEAPYTAGPTIVGNVRTGAGYNAVAPRWAIGNLAGLYDYVTNTYGAAFGDPAAAWVGIDASRVRMMSGTTPLLTAAGGNLTLTGTLDVATSGLIKSGTMTCNTGGGSGAGWVLNYNGGAPCFLLGNTSAGNYLFFSSGGLSMVTTSMEISNTQGILIKPNSYDVSSMIRFQTPSGPQIYYGNWNGVHHIAHLGSAGVHTIRIGTQDNIVGGQARVELMGGDGTYYSWLSVDPRNVSYGYGGNVVVHGVNANVSSAGYHNYNGWTGSTGGTLVACGAYICVQSSTEREKEDIRPLALPALPALRAALARLKPVAFRYRRAGDMADLLGELGRDGIGYLAEDVAKIPALAPLVVRDPDGRPDGIQYPLLPLYLLPILADQDARIAALERRARE
jgi:concanavalin A-like lectin/glucanase superfamily protein